MLDGIRAPRAPALRVAGQGRPGVRESERLGPAADPEIGGGERVGVPEGAHRDHLARPRPDARQCLERRPRPLAVAARTEVELAGAQRVD